MQEYFDEICEFIGSSDVLGSGTYDVFRPNYADPATTAVPISQQDDFRCDFQTGPYPEPRIVGAEYYSVFGRRYTKPGDILVPDPSEPATPRLTIQNIGRIKECVAFRTDRQGILAEASNAPTPIFTNVLFDFAKPEEGKPATDPNPYLEVPPTMAKRAILYYRPGIIIGNYLQDVATGEWYRIQMVNFVGNTLELSLEVTG
jgi:hypothetical protein